MPGSIGRRKFLKLSAGSVVTGVVLGTIGLPQVRSRTEDSIPEVLTREFHLGGGELGRGVSSGLTAAAEGMQLQLGRGVGHLLSQVLESDLPFHYVGLFWSGPSPEEAAFWLRTSKDGTAWSEWEPVHVDLPPGPRAEYENYGSLVWSDGARFLQFMCEMSPRDRGSALQRVGVQVINPYDGPPLETAADPGIAFGGTAEAAEAEPALDPEAAAALAAGKPVNYTREAWGADERLRFSGGAEVWPRAYVPVKKLVVHHTATSNGYASLADAKAQVRSVYHYHAVSQGWGDIGYNCLIDKFGNSYEGRRGRDGPGYDGPGGRDVLSKGVVAGHASAYNYGSFGVSLLGSFDVASPSGAMMSRLRDVLTWVCQQNGIDPMSSSDFLLTNGSWRRGLGNIVGHRDVFNTGCPGGYVYAQLPQLRRDVSARLGKANPSVAITSAPPQSTVTNGEANFAWAGSGSGTLEYSYCLAGWTQIAATGDVKYVRGFTSSKDLAWSPWTRNRSVHLCFPNAGLYTFHLRAREVGSGRLSHFLASRSFVATATGKLCDGSLIRGPSGGAIYYVQGGLKRHVPNPATFDAQRLSWGDVDTVSNASLNGLPTGASLLNALADGNLLKGGGPQVWAIDGGAKRHVASPGALIAAGYGWDAVQPASNALLASLPTGPVIWGPPAPHVLPPNGYLVRGSGSQVYLMVGGLKRHIPNPATLQVKGLLWGNVTRVPDSVLQTIPTGNPLLNVLANGNLLKGSGPEVYAVEGGKKRHIVDLATFEACGYGWDAVYVVANATLNALPTGAQITGPPCPHVSPPDGFLVYGSGPEVYFVNGGLKRHIPNLATFQAYGLLWGNADRVPDSVLAAIPTGEPLLDALADGNLLKGSGPEVWALEGGSKRHVVDLETFAACGYGWDAVYPAADSLLAALPTGAAIAGPPCPHVMPPEGSLVRGSGPEVYVMSGGSRRHIPDPATFAAGGYLWGNVNRLPDSVLGAIPSGEPLPPAGAP